MKLIKSYLNSNNLILSHVICLIYSYSMQILENKLSGDVAEAEKQTNTSQLIKKQHSDSGIHWKTLKIFPSHGMPSTCSETLNISTSTINQHIHSVVIMRAWTPPNVPADCKWIVVHQITVPNVKILLLMRVPGCTLMHLCLNEKYHKTRYCPRFRRM